MTTWINNKLSIEYDDELKRVKIEYFDKDVSCFGSDYYWVGYLNELECEKIKDILIKEGFKDSDIVSMLIDKFNDSLSSDSFVKWCKVHNINLDYHVEY